MATPMQITELAPIQQPLPIVTFAPITAPESIRQLLPTKAVSSTQAVFDNTFSVIFFVLGVGFGVVSGHRGFPWIPPRGASIERHDEVPYRRSYPPKSGADPHVLATYPRQERPGKLFC